MLSLTIIGCQCHVVEFTTGNVSIVSTCIRKHDDVNQCSIKIKKCLTIDKYKFDQTKYYK